jgi:menaquinone-dependent protoporphyrinogen IX oxidase
MNLLQLGKEQKRILREMARNDLRIRWENIKDRLQVAQIVTSDNLCLGSEIKMCTVKTLIKRDVFKEKYILDKKTIAIWSLTPKAKSEIIRMHNEVLKRKQEYINHKL